MTSRIWCDQPYPVYNVAVAVRAFDELPRTPALQVSPRDVAA